MARLISLQKVRAEDAIFPDEVPSFTGSRQEPLDLSDDATVAYWCAHYSVSRDALRSATASVGLMPAALKTYFASRGAANGKGVAPAVSEIAYVRSSRKRSGD